MSFVFWSDLFTQWLAFWSELLLVSLPWPLVWLLGSLRNWLSLSNVSRFGDGTLLRSPMKERDFIWRTWGWGYLWGWVGWAEALKVFWFWTFLVEPAHFIKFVQSLPETVIYLPDGFSLLKSVKPWTPCKRPETLAGSCICEWEFPQFWSESLTGLMSLDSLNLTGSSIKLCFRSGRLWLWTRDGGGWTSMGTELIEGSTLAILHLSCIDYICSTAFASELEHLWLYLSWFKIIS